MKELSKCEEQIMITIWDSESEPSMKSIQVDANKRFKRNWAPQTVTTFLIRLCNKEWLEMKRKGKCAYYYPSLSKEGYRKDLARMQKMHFLLNGMNFLNGGLEQDFQSGGTMM